MNFFSISREDYDILFAPKLVALEFSSDGDFILSVKNPGWNGTIEYSTNKGKTWIEWDGSELSGTATQPIHVRGTNNTKITGNFYYPNDCSWKFTGKYCIGNIETLLDYQTVANDQHPIMAVYCYHRMFSWSASSLTTPPELPATTLTYGCYQGMFENCALTTAPQLPATTLADYCYSRMFAGNRLLSIPPALPATALADYCYDNMFSQGDSMYGSGIVSLPELPATTLVDGCYRDMFSSCQNIKLSTTQTEEYKYEYRIPTSGTGNNADDALNNMFMNTGGMFTETPTINTTYYTTNPPV